MLTAFDNFPALLIWSPLLGAVVSFLLRGGKAARHWALASSLITLGVMVTALFFTENRHYLLNQVSYVWLEGLGSSFGLMLDGFSRLLCLLTAFAYPLILLATRDVERRNQGAFFGLLFLAQAGLMGVFLATDALVFYLFWELALIPVYFLASLWGGEKRVQATFKFFLYTFAGSLLLLVGILYVYLKTASGNFSLVALYNTPLAAGEQSWLFWLFFIAFAIKMPVFPFHTWQPDAYEQADTTVTMVLSGIMVKMGLFAVVRWLIPLFPLAVRQYDDIVIGLSVAGIVYASCIALVQDDLKRLVAYSSIAHIGLMCAALFTLRMEAWQGAMVQMFSHGVNIIGLWIVVEHIERRTGIRRISALGGLAQQAPVLSVLLVVVALANVALPLTNAFVGEFLMFNGVFHQNAKVAAVAGLGIILSAAYTLNMIKGVFLGESREHITGMRDVSLAQGIALAAIVAVILAAGFYPGPVLEMAGETANVLLKRIAVNQP